MGIQTSGTGHFMIPTAPAVGTSCTSGAANVFTTTYVQLIASTVAALYITGIYTEKAAVSAATYIAVQLAVGGAGSETIIDQTYVAQDTGSTVTRNYKPLFPPVPVPASSRISVKTADSVGAQATLITLECIAQSNVVDMGITTPSNVVTIGGQTVSASGTVTFPNATLASTTNITAGTITTVTNQLTASQIATGVWTDTTAGDFTTASSIGKSVMNGVALGTGLTINAYTGNTVQSGDSFARLGAPSGASVSADISVVKTDVLAIPTSNPTVSQIATGVWTDTTAGDFTTASSIGKSLYTSGVVPGGINGLLIAGTNAAVTFKGANASGSTPAKIGLTILGGNASTTAGGTAAVGLEVYGGNGAASTNGAAGGGIISGGNINIVPSPATGLVILGTSSGNGLETDSGSAGGDGFQSNAGGANGNGINAAGNGTGSGMVLYGGAASLSAATIVGTLSTVTTVTNQLTASQIATGVWTATLPSSYTSGEAGYILGNTLAVNVTEISGSSAAATDLMNDILTPVYSIYLGNTPIA